MKVSVIIATHRRPDSLTRLLAVLAAQVVPGRHEIIVAENGTPRPSILAPLPISVNHLHEPAPGKCRIQNRAISLAAGEIVAFLDDDLTPGDAYLAEVEQFFARYLDFAAMKGRILPAEDPDRKAGRAAIYMDLPIADHGEAVIEVKGVLGANMAFRREVFDQAGRFDERLGPGACGHEEDTEFSTRLHGAGLRIGYAPKAVVFHEVDPTRADRARYLRIARERGRCRAIHQRMRLANVLMDTALSAIRVAVLRTLRFGPKHCARAERRLATSLGMLEELRR